MIRVIILDDHNMVIRGLIEMLSRVKEIEVIDTFETGNQLLAFLEEKTADVLLLDINLPDSNGIDLCKIITKVYAAMHIIGLSNYSETSFVKSMMRNGAKGYLLKNTTKEELVKAINSVFNGEVFLSSKIKDKLLQESFGKQTTSFIPKLTRREKEILVAISEELTNNEMAEKLFISVKTVESHRNNLLQKFGVRNTAGLIKEAFKKGLLT